MNGGPTKPHFLNAIIMKIKQILTLTAATLLLGSCTLFRPEKVETRPLPQINSVPQSNVAGLPLPQPPKVAGERPDSATLTSARWLIAGVDGVRIVAEDDAPYIYFEPGTGRFYGSDGCNVLNGDYLMRSDGSMVFSNVISTMKYCSNDYSALIASYIGGQSALYVDTQRIGQDTYLYLRNGADKVVMTLRRHNMEFLNGNWRVTSIGGTAIDDPECNVFFDIAESKVHGNTGCNYFNGDIYIDPNRSNALDLSNMGTTRMACPKGDQEQRMLVALESTVTAVQNPQTGDVMLLDGHGRELMTLTRAAGDEE